MFTTARKLLGKLKRLIQSSDRQDSGPETSTYRRMLSDSPRLYERYIEAAKHYVDSANVGEWIYAKPYDRAVGNGEVFVGLYQVLNIIEAMRLPRSARILEVGSGPGWITEVLMLLGFEVDAIEPAENMIEVAKHRLRSCVDHHRLTEVPEVRFHCQTLEECELPDDVFEGVLFHEALHHVIDEEDCLAKVYRMLSPGGVIGVSGEPAWIPGCREMEEAFEEETRRFGTLENPFFPKYLVDLLDRLGFVDIQRYHGVNGLVPIDDGHRSAAELARFPAVNYLTLTARKTYSTPTSIDPVTETKAEIEVLESGFDPSSRRLKLRVRLTNTGKTVWLDKRPQQKITGVVTMALVQSSGDGFREASPRTRLPRVVFPGDCIELHPEYTLPVDYAGEPWVLDMTNEWQFWFSQRGTKTVEVPVPEIRSGHAA